MPRRKGKVQKLAPDEPWPKTPEEEQPPTVVEEIAVPELQSEPIAIKYVPNEPVDIQAICADPSSLDAYFARNDEELVKYIIQNLPIRSVEARVRTLDRFDSAISVWNVIDAITHYELTYLKLNTNYAEEQYKRQVKDPYLSKEEKQAIKPPKKPNLKMQRIVAGKFAGPQLCPFLVPGLVDAYETYESFRMLPLSAEEQRIPFLTMRKNYRPHRPKTKEEIVYSIPEHAEFRRRFEIFTQGQLEGWTDWSNMIVVGGAVVNCLLPIPKKFEDNVEYFYQNIAYKTSDIDIYFYNVSASEFSRKLMEFYYFLKRNNPATVAVKTPHTLTFCSEYPNRHIQVVIGDWKSIEHILFEPDIDCSCFAYNNQTLWTTQRGRFSMNRRAIVASPLRYQVRGHPEYESRLVKYSKRGFVIWDRKLDWNEVSKHYIKRAYGYLMRTKTVVPRMEVYGLRLLILLHNYKDDFQDTDIATVLSGDPMPGNFIIAGIGIPYGKNWPLFKIVKGLEQGIFTPNSYGAGTPTILSLLRDFNNAHNFFESTSNRLLSLESSPNPPDWYNRIFKSQELEETSKRYSPSNNSMYRYYSMKKSNASFQKTYESWCTSWRESINPQ